MFYIIHLCITRVLTWTLSFVDPGLVKTKPHAWGRRSQDQREDPLVEPWLANPTTSADVSQPGDASSSLAAPSTISRSTFSPSHTGTLNDPTRHARFLHPPSGSPSSRQSFPVQQHPGSLSRHLSDPNIRSAVAAQPPSHYALTNPAKRRYPQWRQSHRQSFQYGLPSVLPSPSSASFSADRRPSTAGSAASSSCWEQWDTRAESLQEVTGVLPTQDLPPIAPGDHNTSPVESSGLDDPLLPHDAPQNRLHSPGSSSLVPIARSVVSEEEHESIPPDPSV
ncbi:hypothetical protein BGW80DRAFT_1454994 [Lactifluus volemus]|nr:hypothetical protein BGW80DRAFT_1454994 [Lactifluus volemus]